MECSNTTNYRIEIRMLKCLVFLFHFHFHCVVVVVVFSHYLIYNIKLKVVCLFIFLLKTTSWYFICLGIWIVYCVVVRVTFPHSFLVSGRIFHSACHRASQVRWTAELNKLKKKKIISFYNNRNFNILILTHTICNYLIGLEREFTIVLR